MADRYIDYERLDDEALPRKIRAALAAQEGLKLVLSSLLHLSREASWEQRALSSLCADADAIGDFFSSLFNPETYNERCSILSNATAKTVFGIPEILELILLQLTVAELLKSQQVNRQFRDAVLGSIKLKRTLCLLPEPEDSHLRLTEIFEELPGIYCSLAVSDQSAKKIYEIGLADNEEGVHAGFHRAHQYRIGACCRRMLFCQPPLKAMSVYVSCCTTEFDEWLPSDPITVVRNEEGLTVGDVYDVSDRLVREHKSCPYALWNIHDDDGSVRVTVHLRGVVQLHEGDPILLEDRQTLHDAKEAALKQISRRKKMVAFAAAKSHGMCRTYCQWRQC